jgi:enamine deaminase RidA (YjgF/YER057c/UK114 family)
MTGPDSGVTVSRYTSGGPWEETYGYSRVVRAGGFYLTAGTTATVDGVVTSPGDPYAQAVTAFRIALQALAAAGADLADVVRSRMYVTAAEHADPVGRAHGEIFAGVRPVATLVVVAGLLDPAMLVEVELEAVAMDRVQQ